jgi:hypothetical protein
MILQIAAIEALLAEERKQRQDQAKEQEQAVAVRALIVSVECLTCNSAPRRLRKRHKKRKRSAGRKCAMNGTSGRAAAVLIGIQVI